MKQKRLTGTIKYWNGRKGFGFLETEGEEKQVFIHIKAFAIRKTKPAIGQVVTYTLSEDEQGRTRANDVLYDGEEAPESMTVEADKIRKSAGLPFVIISVSLIAVIAYLISHVVAKFG
jgi:cold shock CspA family protein